MRLVVLPQAVRITVPPLISQTLSLWKNTSIATVIGTAELMYQAQRVETATFRGAETFAVDDGGVSHRLGASSRSSACCISAAIRCAAA